MKQTEKIMKTNNFSKNTNQISIMENLRIGSIVKAIDGEKGTIVDIVESFVIIKLDESVNEGKKVFKVNPGIGKAKYSISSNDGVKKHKDGSDFFDIEIFKNKVDLKKAIKNYTSKGFVKESDWLDELKLSHKSQLTLIK